MEVTQAECVQIKGREYRVRTINVTTESVNKNVVIPAGCNGWNVLNNGTCVAWVDDRPIKPPPAPTVSGESFGVFGNDGDFYTGDITIKFDATTGGLVYISFFIYKFK